MLCRGVCMLCRGECICRGECMLCRGECICYVGGVCCVEGSVYVV